jgi:hypothetical protein
MRVGGMSGLVPKTTGARAASFVFTCFLISPKTAHAYRPFNGTDADVAEQGVFELELGPVNLARQRQPNYYLLAPVTVLNLGIFARAELVVDFVGNAPLRPQPGEAHYQIRDTDVLLKFILRKGALQNESGPSIALEAGPLVPEIFGQRGFGAAANLIVSERWRWFIAHLNNEAQLSRSDLNLVWSNSLIAELRFNETAWPVAELLWERNFGSRVSSYSALAGLIWSAFEGFDFDAAAVVASVAGRPAFEGRLGFTWALQVWETGNHASNGPERNAHE